jgi:flagellar biogenesis protein FliO
MKFIATSIALSACVFGGLVLAQDVKADSARDASLDTGSRMERINALVTQREEQLKAGRDSSQQPPISQSGEGAGMGLRMLEGLALCTALFFIGMGAYRKISGDRPMPRGRRLRLVERMAVAPKTSLVLATVDGKEVLLAVGDKVSFMRLSPEDQYVDEMELICQEDEEQQQSAS